MTGKTISHYKILEKLGEGGMGVVYKAEDLKLTRTVALKFLPHGLDAHEPERERFLQEARAAAILNHPNVCTIYDIAEADGQQFIVMEYVEGKTLREIVPVKKTQDAIGYAVQIAEALKEAHTHGIVHRDIKAENIMVNSKNQVKVMDFGLAKLKGSLKLTKTSSTIGTLAYMAPELIQGEQVDARSDIFSFGIVLYEMLTGHLPFKGEHEAAIVYSIMNEEPLPLKNYVPDAQSELLHILDRALEKDREDRYQTAQDMLIDLRRLKKDSVRVSREHRAAAEVPLTAEAGVPVLQKKPWNRALWLGVAGVVTLSVIAALLLVPGRTGVRLNPDRTSVTFPLPFREIQYPSLSRDGNWIAFPAKDEKGKWDLYLMNTAGGTPNRATNVQASYLDAVDIAPDVSQLAYVCQMEPGDAPSVRLVASQGGAGRILADSGIVPKWRPDGKRIGYIRFRQPSRPSTPGSVEIWSVNPDGTDSRLEFTDPVPPRGPIAFSWSPDGESIAWVRNSPEGYGEVIVRELATGEERQLTFDKKTVDEVVWTTSGMVLFISDRSGQSNLWVVPAGGGEATQVTQGAVPILAARISSDNRTLIYLQQEAVGHIWISALDGSDAHQVTSSDINPAGAAFSPDGKQISFIFSDVDPLHNETHLSLMDRDGSNLRQLTSGAVKVSMCVWSPDGKWLAYSARGLKEPRDSSRVYLIRSVNPSPPRLLCKGTWPAWPDNESVTVWNEMKTLRHSIRGGEATQVYRDSALVLPAPGKKQILFYDNRGGREGLWTVAVDSLRNEVGKARLLIPPNVAFTGPPDWRFFLYRKGDNELRRLWTSSMKEERIGRALPGDATMTDVSADGKEILWIKYTNPSKLVLVKDLFE